MNDEKKQLSKARQALVDRVLSRLDAGAMPWDNGMSGFAAPKNAVTGKAYRGINLLALFCADKPDPRWMTFAQAKEQGYAVKQGAKGVPIEWYSYIDKRTNKPADVAAVIEETKDMTFDEKQRFKKDNLRTVVRGYHVFNASDIHGIEPYVAPPVDVSKRNERIENIIASSEAPISYDGNGRNYYSPTSDSIHLTDRSAFKSDEFFYNTALHEMAHSTGHRSRLGRDLGGDKGSKAYAREELVAELSSVMTAAELGLDHSDRVIENSAEYVRSWAQLIREEPQILIDATFDASHATDYICGKERQAEKSSEENAQKEKAALPLRATFEFNTDGIDREVINAYAREHGLSRAMFGLDDGLGITESLELDSAPIDERTDRARFLTVYNDSKGSALLCEHTEEARSVSWDIEPVYSNVSGVNKLTAYCTSQADFDALRKHITDRVPSNALYDVSVETSLPVPALLERTVDAEAARAAVKENAQKDGLKSNIREWYARQFPKEHTHTATLGQNATFGELRDALRDGKSIESEFVGLEMNGAMRERVLGKLSEILDLPYSSVYEKWRENVRQATADSGAVFGDVNGKKVLVMEWETRDLPKTKTADREASPPEPPPQQQPQHNKPLVVNFYGGPGSGKTTAALELTAALKKAGYNVEYVSEFAKQLVLENKTELLKNQQYVTDGQYALLNRIRNNADVIVTDSPVLLGLVYGKYNGISDEYAKKIRSYHDSFDNFNMFVERPTDATFQKERRIHDEAQSVKLDGEIKDMLKAQTVFCGSYKRDDISNTVGRISTTYNRLYGERSAQKESMTATVATTAPRPTFKPENIPEEMKVIPNWCAYHRLGMDAKGHYGKKLYDCNKTEKNEFGALDWAKSDDPSTWTTFDKADAYRKQFKRDGVAFGLTEEAGILCIDLDKSIDGNGKLSDAARQFLAAAGGTYVERSTSGHGLHIFCLGHAPEGYGVKGDKIDVEVFDRKRFLSMTGDIYGDASRTLKPATPELMGLLKANLKAQPKTKPREFDRNGLSVSDSELLERIGKSRRSVEFDALMRGELLVKHPDGSGDPSGSDFKLCGILAFFSGGNVDQVVSLIKRSGLYRPDKPDKYYEMTARNACSRCNSVYDPSGGRRGGTFGKSGGGKPNGTRSNGGGRGAGR